MAKFNKTLTDFSFGVLSRKMAGRIDTDNYAKGLSDSSNFLGLPTGAVIKRPGSRYLLNLKSVSDLATPTPANKDLNNSAIIPFYRTDGENFLIVCNFEDTQDVNPLIISNRLAIIKSDGTVTGYSVGSGPDTGFTTNHNLWYVQTGNILIIGNTSGTARPFVIQWKTPGLYGGGFLVYDYFINLADSVKNYIVSMPYLERNITSVALTPSGTTGSITLSSSASFFTTAHIGARFRIVQGTTEGVCIVTAFTSATAVTATVEGTFGATSASTNWSESAFSDAQGWPRSAVMFQQRLVFGGTSNKPDTIWFSLEGNIFHMMQEKILQDKGTTDVTGLGYYGAIAADDAMDITIASNRANLIKWMAAKDVLVAGTSEEEYVISDVTASGNPRAIIKQQTAIGSIPHNSITAGDSVIYINRNGKELYNFKYNDTNASFVSNSLNILNDEISEYALSSISRSRAYIRKIVWQESRNTIWALTSDQDLISCLVTPDFKSAGWFKHYIADNSNSAENIIDIAVIPANGTDTLYLIKRRVINSETRDYIEYIGDDFKEYSLYELSFSYASDAPVFLDSGIHLNAPVTTTLSGLSHLRGENVTVVADGNQLAGTFLVNASGQITLPAVYTAYVQVGYFYNSFIQTMDFEAGKDSDGDSAGTIKRMDRAFIKFWQTREGNVGSSAIDIVPISFDTTTILYSGDKKELMNHTPEEQSKVYISQSYAYPMCVLSVTIRGVTYD
jgi:hypothetical protein